MAPEVSDRISLDAVSVSRSVTGPRNACTRSQQTSAQSVQVKARDCLLVWLVAFLLVCLFARSFA